MGSCSSSSDTTATPELTRKQIDFLKRKTKFTETEIRQWHSAFIRDCPNGKLDRKNFTRICQKFYPNGNVGNFSKYVFAAVDENNDGAIDFVEYLRHVDVLVQGDLDARLELAFEMYDTKRDGQIDQKELANMISAASDLANNSNRQSASHAKKQAATVMAKFDLNGDNKLTKREFIIGCKSDATLQRLLVPNA